MMPILLPSPKNLSAFWPDDNESRSQARQARRGQEWPNPTSFSSRRSASQTGTQTAIKFPASNTSITLPITLPITHHKVFLLPYNSIRPFHHILSLNPHSLPACSPVLNPAFLATSASLFLSNARREASRSSSITLSIYSSLEMGSVVLSWEKLRVAARD